MTKTKTLKRLIEKIEKNTEKLNTIPNTQKDKAISDLLEMIKDLQKKSEENTQELDDLKIMHTLLAEHNSTIENQLNDEKTKMSDELNKFEFIMNESKDYVGLINKKLCYEAVNDSFCHYFLKKRSTLIGEKISSLWGDSIFKQHFKDPIKKTFLGNSHFFQFEKEINNQRHYFEASLYPYSYKGKVINVVTTFKDITEKKELEEQIIRSQRINSIGKLASGIAHDLNNILSPFYIAIKTLSHKLNNDKNSLKILDILNVNTERAANLIKQILTFSQGVEGKKITLDLKFIIEEVKGLLEETFPKDITLTTKLSRYLWTIKADATQIHQLLLNLCLNAKDAMPKGGTLEIIAKNKTLKEKTLMGTRVSGEFSLLIIKDSGIGMENKVLSQIFEPFFTTKELGKGTGLGLSTVMGVIKSHNGYIDVQSTPKHGSTFTIYLPSSKKKEKSISKNINPKNILGNGETILLIDDESALRDMISSTLKKHNYSVLMAENGRKGLQIFKRFSKKIDIVIIDMIMPLMDGPNTIKRLKKINPDLKIIRMTGVILEDKETYLEDKTKNTNVFLNKPFKEDTLLKTLNESLSSKKKF